MTPTHQHLLTQLRELHKQMGEVLQQIEQAETATEQTVKFADRLKQVQEQRDRPTLKRGDEAPAIVWLEMMDEPERSEALKWANDKEVKLMIEQVVKSIHAALWNAFNWHETGSFEKWSNIYDKYKRANR